MNNYIKSNSSQGDTLQHWKYIKRKRIKGKWRYWYDEESFKKDMKNLMGYDERERLQKARAQYNEDLKRYEVSNKQTKYDADRYANPLKNETYKYTDSYSTTQKLAAKANQSKKQLDKCLKKYEMTPVGMLNKVAKLGSDYISNKLKEHGLLDKSTKQVKEIVDKNITPEELEKNHKDMRFKVLNGNKPEQPTLLAELYNKVDEFSIEEDQDAVNPNYSPYKEAYSTNCALCTAAMDLRLRGYDVEANPMTDELDGEYYNTDVNIITWYEGASYETMTDVLKRQGYEVDDVLQRTSDDTDSILPDFIDDALDELARKEVYDNNGQEDMSEGYTIKNHISAADAIKKDMLSHGEGSRGFMLTNWEHGGGHACLWSVENGEVIIRETQTNDIVTVDYYVWNSANVAYFRTDNLEPTDNITAAVRNRKRGK